MGKCITINSCKDCPYSGVDYFREHFMKAWCGHSQMRWTNNNWEWHSKTIEEESDYLAFPPWCPLDDAADESSIGDLTPEDIQRINETARRIKNAKNVKDQRYG